MLLPKEKQQTLNHIVTDLQQTNHVLAVVLGGSYAAGYACENSDLDIGIYYSEQHPFNINDIRLIAKKYSVVADTTVTDFYEWGPWVNGGAWIQTACGKVDFIYRNHSMYQVPSKKRRMANGKFISNNNHHSVSIPSFTWEKQTAVSLCTTRTL